MKKIVITLGLILSSFIASSQITWSTRPTTIIFDDDGKRLASKDTTGHWFISDTLGTINELAKEVKYLSNEVTDLYKQIDSLNLLLHPAKEIPITTTFDTSQFTLTRVGAEDSLMYVISYKPLADRFDTVKCLLFVCDTTLMLQEKGNRYYDNGTYWQYGWNIRKYEDVMGFTDPTPVHSYYLDEDKTRFKKNIVIWQSLNLLK